LSKEISCEGCIKLSGCIKNIPSDGILSCYIEAKNHTHDFSQRKFCEKGCCEWYECECGERQYVRIG
jgi:hypothetical protein